MEKHMELIFTLVFLAVFALTFYAGIKAGYKELPASRGLFGWGVFGLSALSNVAWIPSEQATDFNSFWVAFFAALVVSIVGTYFTGKITARWAKANNRNAAWSWWLMVPFGYFAMLFASPKTQEYVAQEAHAKVDRHNGLGAAGLNT